jgi:two-component system, response regulator
MESTEMIIVEDNRHDAEMVLDALQELKMNVKVEVLQDGAEAVKYFFAPASKFNGEKIQLPRLVLLDLKLPKFNGLEVLKMMKSNEKTKYMPVVIFTSSNEEKDRIAAYALGANSYLVKPLSADELSEYIRRIVNYWVKLNLPADLN